LAEIEVERLRRYGEVPAAVAAYVEGEIAQLAEGFEAIVSAVSSRAGSMPAGEQTEEQ